jgi:tight adherence protein B
MGLLVLGFVSILLITFALIVAMTRRSPLEKSIAQRMALIRSSSRGESDDFAETSSQLFKVSKPGKFGWFNEILERYQFSQKLQSYIVQANSSTTVASLLIKSVTLFLIGYLIAWLVVPVLLIDVAVGAALGYVPFGFLSFKRSRRVNAFNAVLAESIDMLARALRAGYSVVGAIGMISENAQEPAATEFGEIFKQQNLGLPLRDALLQLLERVPSLDLRVLVTALLVQKDTGGNLAEILDRTVFVIRERLRIQGEIRVHTAQGRLTGWILCALPVLMLVLINILNPGYSNVFLYDPLGRKLVYLCLGMLTVGTVIINRIVNGIEV